MLALLVEQPLKSWSAPDCRGCSKRLRKRLQDACGKQPERSALARRERVGKVILNPDLS